MIIETNLFLQYIWMILEREFAGNILLLDFLNVVKAFLVIGQNLSRVIEVHSNHIITKNISNTVFRRIIYPFLNCDVVVLGLNY